MTATLEVRYEPRGGALELLHATEDEICISGPAGTGKSVAALFRIFLTCLNVPNTRALVVRQTHASLTSTTLITFEHKVAAAALAMGAVKWFGGSPRQPPAYRFWNGSTIVVGGLDRPEKFLSAELDIIFIDEAVETTVTALETLISRIRGTALKNKQIILACNPAHPTHWIKQRCDKGTMRMIVSRHADNPFLVNDDGTYTEAGKDYMAKLDALTGVRRLRLRDGIWAAAEGIVYDEFDEGHHVIPRFDVPDTWQRWWSVDFGYTNPFVLQCWAEDGDGRAFLVREAYYSQRLVEEHALTILQAVTRVVSGKEEPKREVLTALDIQADVRAGIREWIEPKPRAIVCDHDAEDRATLEKHVGLPTTAANKRLRPKEGVELVKSRTKRAGDGRARLYYFADALIERDPKLEEKKLPCSTVEEKSSYIWDDKKDAPVKENDHGCDCERYYVVERDSGGRPRVRFI